MEEQLITFETAVLAKNKGYTNSSCKQYNRLGTHLYDSCNAVKLASDLEFVVPAPTQSLLQKWLREVHKIHVEVWYCPEETDGFTYTTTFYDAQGNDSEVDGSYFDNYEEALEYILQEALKLI